MTAVFGKTRNRPWFLVASRQGGKMKPRGQLQLEAIACFAAFMAFAGILIAAINATAEDAGQALDAVNARSNAESCCIIADAIFASNASGLSGTEMPCKAGGREVESIVGGKSRKCACLSEEVRLVQAGAKSILEVKTDGHYR